MFEIWNAISMIPGYIYTYWYGFQLPYHSLLYIIACNISILYHFAIHYNSRYMPILFKYDILMQQWLCLLYAYHRWLQYLIACYMCYTSHVTYVFKQRRWFILFNGITILCISYKSLYSFCLWSIAFMCFALKKENLLDYGHVLFHLFGHMGIVIYTEEVLLLRN